MSFLLRAVPLHLPSSPERSLDGWSSEMSRALCGGCGCLQRLKISVEWKLYKIPMLMPRSVQKLSSSQALCQIEETQGEGQMQSHLEASPFQLRDRPPPTHPGLCLLPELLQPPSVQLWPKYQVAICGAGLSSPVCFSALSLFLLPRTGSLL